MTVEWKSLVLENDLRLSDAREWTANTVSQLEAEAGLAITRRAWTAQRVAQAIAALSGGAGPTILTFEKIITTDSDLGSIVILAPFTLETIPTYSLDFAGPQYESVDLGGLI